jgi:REP element-mobilizing transposase RayT
MYHVGSRGNNKDVVFFDDHDRRGFLDRLGRTSIRHGWMVLAYCLMGTHYHVVLQVPIGGLSAGMRLLNGGFSHATNRRYGRSRHLFQNRFFSVEIESDGHLLEVCRYVVLNPVRAGLCNAPEEWPWSSYRSCAGLDVGPAFLARSRVLGLFGGDARQAEEAYRAFVREGYAVSDSVTEA